MVPVMAHSRASISPCGSEGCVSTKPAIPHIASGSGSSRDPDLQSRTRQLPRSNPDGAGLRGAGRCRYATPFAARRDRRGSEGGAGVGMAVLVTGSAGFIGFHVAAHLLDRGERVI